MYNSKTYLHCKRDVSGVKLQNFVLNIFSQCYYLLSINFRKTYNLASTKLLSKKDFVSKTTVFVFINF